MAVGERLVQRPAVAVVEVKEERRSRVGHDLVHDAAHAAELYRDGASHAVPETLESSLQLSEAVLIDLGVAMGPVIASIHEKRDEFRDQIMHEGELEFRPSLKSGTLREREAAE